ncbi:aureocin A53 family class IId bacteriocin [Lactococcus lactis]|nr:aureocin A53 family class IId bacteriocin [Lactococcus lactis]MDM7657619.1 aureocin A53 family class IId bacteriocin [Lactococcus lactis]
MEVLLHMWGRILGTVAKYGPKAVSWAWQHKWELINMGDLAFRYIQRIWG